MDHHSSAKLYKVPLSGYNNNGTEQLTSKFAEYEQSGSIEIEQTVTFKAKMSELDKIKSKINITETDIAEAKEAKDFARRDRLEALLTEQQKKENLLLANQGKFTLLPLFIALSCCKFVFFFRWCVFGWWWNQFGHLLMEGSSKGGKRTFSFKWYGVVCFEEEKIVD